MSEADSLPFSAGQEHHGITADQFDLREVDGDDTVFLKRCAKDIQAFTGNPTADAKNDTLFIRKPVDSAGHDAACSPVRVSGKPNARQNALKVQQKRMSRRSELVNLANVADVADLASVSET